MTALEETIRAHIQKWSELLKGRAFWPTHVYHFTDLHNVPGILQSGNLYSRRNAEELALIKTSAASSDVIAHTALARQRYARLYFRPRTPTQYRNEGIRPAARLWGGAHCPVPIFLCFDALAVLTRPDTEVSNGNMASGNARYGSVEDVFDDIPFRHVFHEGWWSEEEGEIIKFHRHAEILVPGALPLRPSLSKIVCRSAAERTSLLHLLPPATRRQFNRLVEVPQEGFFERKWTFVESVSTVDDRVVFHFNPNSTIPGPFHVKFQFEEPNRKPLILKRDVPQIGASLGFRVGDAERGVATLTLDGCTAFCGEVTLADAPF